MTYINQFQLAPLASTGPAAHPDPYIRTFHTVGYQSMALAQLRVALGLGTVEGCAEALWSGIDSVERLEGGRQVRINAAVNYGVDFTEERIWGALEGY